MAKTRGRGEGAVRLRSNGTWEGRISIGFGPGGKRMRKSVYGASKAEVLELIARARFEHGYGYSTTAPMTVGEYLDRWLRDFVQPKRRHNTFKSYALTVEKHIKPHIGSELLTELTAMHMDVFERRLEKAGTKPATAWYACILLKSAIRRAAGRGGLLKYDPFSAVSLSKPKAKKFETWTIEHARAFFAATESHRLYPFFVLAASVGLRHGELLGLKWEDIDFEGGELTVKRTLVDLSGGKFDYGAPKTEAGEAKVTVPRETLAILRRLRLKTPGDFVFVTRAGSHYLQTNVRKAFTALAAKSEVPRIRVHDLRHTCATLLLAAGKSPKAIQELLRHEDFMTTMNTYVHVTKEEKQDLAETMDRLLWGGK